MNRAEALFAREGAFQGGGRQPEPAWRRTHPLVAFFFYAAAAALSMLLTHPLLLAVSLGCSIALVLLQNGARAMRPVWIPYAVMALALLALNPLFSHRGSHLLAYAGGNPITLEAVVYGGTTALSLLTLLVLFISYRLAVTTQAFLYLFARISPQAALALMLALRFVPLFIRRLREIALIQRTRGVDAASGPPLRRVRDAMLQLRVLAVWSLEEAMQTADSMQARGYGSRARTNYHDFRWRGSDAVKGLLMLAAFAFCAVDWRLTGGGAMAVYPVMDDPRLSAGDWLALAGQLLLYAVPIWTEGMMRWRWR